MRPISAEATRGYSQLNSGTSKGSFTPLLQLEKFPDIPVSTREEARESRPHPEEPRFCLLARKEGSFSCVVGKEFPASVAPQEEALSTGKPRGTPGSCHHSQNPPDVSVYYRETCFPPHCLDFQAEDRLTPWWPVGQPCGKASWESLVGKPRGKATDPLIHAKGTVTLLLQLGRKAHVHALSRDND